VTVGALAWITVAARLTGGAKLAGKLKSDVVLAAG
jgi:hypothetical protein